MSIPSAPSKILQPGTTAPYFSLPQTFESSIALSDLRGQPIVLFFYPLDFSPDCSAQAVLYNETLEEFERFNAQLLGISIDSPLCHAAFSREYNLRFPLLSDFEPKGAVARKYNAYREQDGVAERAIFVINPQGVISWSYLSPIYENPGADGILTALEELSR